jgi:hypothetical protein
LFDFCKKIKQIFTYKSPVDVVLWAIFNFIRVLFCYADKSSELCRVILKLLNIETFNSFAMKERKILTYGGYFERFMDGLTAQDSG